MLSNNNIPLKNLNQKMPVPKDYHHHLRRINNVTHYVDNRPPKLHISYLMKPTPLRIDNEQLIKTTRRNVELLAKINKIKRLSATNYATLNNEYLRDSLPYKIRLIKDIQKSNYYIADRLLNIKCEVESCKKLKKYWKNILKLIKCMSRFPIILPDLLNTNSLKLNNLNNNYRPLVYLDLGIKNGRPLGRIIIILYLDLAPRTVKNFIDLCENHRDWPILFDDTDEIDCNCQLINTTFNRIFTNLFIYGGNLNYNKKIKNFRGIPNYEPEAFHFHHGYKGTLSMCPMENGYINSEFTISLKPLHVLDGKRLAFGRVIRGLSILDTVANYGTKNGKPKAKVEIFNCGLLK